MSRLNYLCRTLVHAQMLVPSSLGFVIFPASYSLPLTIQGNRSRHHVYYVYRLRVYIRYFTNRYNKKLIRPPYTSHAEDQPTQLHKYSRLILTDLLLLCGLPEILRERSMQRLSYSFLIPLIFMVTVLDSHEVHHVLAAVQTTTFIMALTIGGADSICPSLRSLIYLSYLSLHATIVPNPSCEN